MRFAEAAPVWRLVQSWPEFECCSLTNHCAAARTKAKELLRHPLPIQTALGCGQTFRPPRELSPVHADARGRFLDFLE
jgi:hypothetical protein